MNLASVSDFEAKKYLDIELRNHLNRQKKNIMRIYESRPSVRDQGISAKLDKHSLISQVKIFLIRRLLQGVAKISYSIVVILFTLSASVDQKRSAEQHRQPGTLIDERLQ